MGQCQALDLEQYSKYNWKKNIPAVLLACLFIEYWKRND